MFLVLLYSSRAPLTHGYLPSTGLVGGWIVQHLLMRGESAQAIRIVDLSRPTRKEVTENKDIGFVATDITDADAVSKAFEAPWPQPVASLPLTVFHCAALISPRDRHPIFLPKYEKVNVQGTENVLKAAQRAGASCFISTSSASVGLQTPNYFGWPGPDGTATKTWQLSPNAEPSARALAAKTYSASGYGSCYAWTKLQAERMVRAAHDPSTGFLTGSIRPGHAIYGHGVQNPSSVTWDYLRRGGSPTWLSHCVANFVAAQNVSIGHLAYENTLLLHPERGGQGFCVTDPNPPIRYQDLYHALTLLAHPSTPVAFPYIPHMPLLLLSYFIEAYNVLQTQYLAGVLPALGNGDLSFVQPAVSSLCVMHIVYTDTAAQETIGYRAPITTLEGFMLAVRDWNDRAEEKQKLRVGDAKLPGK